MSASSKLLFLKLCICFQSIDDETLSNRSLPVQRNVHPYSFLLLFLNC